MRSIACILVLAGCSSPAATGGTGETDTPPGARAEPVSAFEARLPPPEAYIRPEDQERARRRDPDDFPCTSVERPPGYAGDVIVSLPTDQCYHMLPPQRYEGLWRADFEGSLFCPSPARTCSHETPGLKIWLSLAGRQAATELEGRGGLYAVQFEGRQTLHRGVYGHLGMADHEIIVDRMIALREVEPPPPEPTEAEVRE